MSRPRKSIALVTVSAVVLALPTAAGAVMVPPGNSAANQYTEALPTAGGPKDTSGGNGNGGTRTPSQALGHHNAKKLAAEGAEGQAAAEVAAETAPEVQETAPPPSQPVTTTPKAETTPHPEAKPAAGNGQSSATQHHAHTTVAAASAGSSGLVETAAQASGASSPSGTSLLLPLALAATIAWALFYALRRRKRTA